MKHKRLRLERWVHTFRRDEHKVYGISVFGTSAEAESIRLALDLLAEYSLCAANRVMLAYKVIVPTPFIRSVAIDVIDTIYLNSKLLESRVQTAIYLLYHSSRVHVENSRGSMVKAHHLPYLGMKSSKWFLKWLLKDSENSIDVSRESAEYLMTWMYGLLEEAFRTRLQIQKDVVNHMMETIRENDD